MTAINEIKQRIDIVELVSDYVPLQASGRNLKGLCPFHSEKHPSFRNNKPGIVSAPVLPVAMSSLLS